MSGSFDNGRIALGRDCAQVGEGVHIIAPLKVLRIIHVADQRWSMQWSLMDTIFRLYQGPQLRVFEEARYAQFRKQKKQSS